MKIRPAEDFDARSIAAIHVGAWQVAYEALLPTEYLASLSIDNRAALWAAAILSGEPTVLVAEVGEAVIGFSAFGRCRDADGSANSHEIWAIYLDPNYWSQGVGRALWLASQEALCQQGSQRITLWVFAENRRAIGFYEAMGFVVDHGYTQSVERGGVSLQEIRYVIIPDRR